MGETEVIVRSGYFGKVPTQGDFVSNGLQRNLADALDRWLRQAMQQSQRRMGRDWLDAFLVAPIWRMALTSGTLGPDPVVGLMMPSVDRIGRYFPLVIAAQLTGLSPDVHDMIALTEWYDAAEKLALSTLDPGFLFANFDQAVTSLGMRILPEFWSRHSKGKPLSVWWCGSSPDEVVQFNGMPDPHDFERLFLLTTTVEAVSPAAQQPPVSQTNRTLLSVDCAAASLKGLRSPALMEATAIAENQQAMSVISGVGKLVGTRVAVQIVADTLSTIENPFSMNDLVAEAKGKLGTANALLRARNQPPGEVSAASTVTLLVQAQRYSVLWAGNARAYLLRDGVMTLLTRDHVEARLPTVLIRAVGGPGPLLLDTVAGEAREDDRFLLCSAGLAVALTEQEIASTLANAASAQQVVTRLTQDALIAGGAADVTALAVILSARAPGRRP
ncbi:type VI secretion system-associated protein TagF [Tabrizicola sp.]|uniref:type VI secretion system-associated protein TagF n=1 Tax=Tabrizicola sp. TaxID=2005166 RepID=UPI003F3C3BCA